MERLHFKYEVLTMLRLTKPEVEILSKLCESHYDHAVKALSVPGAGAVLNAARNTFESGEDGVEFADVEFTSRQLDTLAKATEGAWVSPFISRGGEFAFYQKLTKMLREAHTESARINPDHIGWNNAKLEKMRKE